jgi:Pectate lyase superfamily protein
MPYLAGFVTPQDYGAAGNGTTDDTAAINSALSTMFSTYGGGVVLLPWTEGGYLVSGTISIPPYTILQGQAQLTLNLFSTPTNISRIVASASWAPSSTTGIVSILSKTPGGWGINNQSCGLENVFIDGSLNSNSNLQGVQLTGPVYDVHLEDVFVFKAPHNGVNASSQTESGITPTYPYHQRYDRVAVANSGNSGFNLVNFTDSSFVNCLGFGNTGANYVIQNMSNSVFTACRAEWSSSNAGYSITGTSGSITFTGCTTDQNAEEAFYINSAAGQSVSGGGIIITGGKLHSDGNAGTSGHTSGINVNSSTVPVIISGVNVEAGQNGASYFPANAVSLTSSPNVTVTGSILQGVTSAWLDNGGNTNLTRAGCIGATGNPGSQTIVGLSNLPLPNVPTPADQNLIAWSFDQATANATAAPSLGVVRLCRVEIRQATTITNVLMSIPATSGSGLTTSENFAGLYSSSGTLLSATADQTTNWGSTGLKTMALTSAQAVAPGVYYVGFVANAGTSAPSFLVGSTQAASVLNAGLTAATARYATNGTGVTTLPASITMSGVTTSGTSYWVAVS